MNNYPYLKDTEFLKTVNEYHNKEQLIKITVLNWREQPLQDITGNVLDGNINLDGSSAMRRTANITLLAEDSNNDLTNINNIISINKKIEVLIGFTNTFGKYENYPVIWFPQGIFLIVGANISRDISGAKISLTLHDKMALLNGECGGVIPAAVNFHEIEETDVYGNVTVSQPTIVQIIQELVNHFGGEQLGKIIIKDLQPKVKQVLKWNGTQPLYICKDNNYGIALADTSIYNLYKEVYASLQYYYYKDENPKLSQHQLKEKARTRFDNWINTNISTAKNTEIKALINFINKIKTLQESLSKQKQELDQWTEKSKELETQLKKRDTSLIAEVRESLAELASGVKTIQKNVCEQQTLSKIFKKENESYSNYVCSKKELRRMGEVKNVIEQLGVMQGYLTKIKRLYSKIEIAMKNYNNFITGNSGVVVDDGFKYNVSWIGADGRKNAIRIISPDVYQELSPESLNKKNYYVFDYAELLGTLLSFPFPNKDNNNNFQIRGDNYTTFFEDNANYIKPILNTSQYAFSFPYQKTPIYISIQSKNKTPVLTTGKKTTNNKIYNKKLGHYNIYTLSLGSFEIEGISDQLKKYPYYFWFAEFLKIRHYLVNGKNKITYMPQKFKKQLIEIEKDIDQELRGLYHIGGSVSEPTIAGPALGRLLSYFSEWCNIVKEFLNEIKDASQIIVDSFKEAQQSLRDSTEFSFKYQNKWLPPLTTSLYDKIIQLAELNDTQNLSKYFSDADLKILIEKLNKQLKTTDKTVLINEDIKNFIKRRNADLKNLPEDAILSIYRMSYNSFLSEKNKQLNSLIEALPYQLVNKQLNQTIYFRIQAKKIYENIKDCFEKHSILLQNLFEIKQNENLYVWLNESERKNKKDICLFDKFKNIVNYFYYYIISLYKYSTSIQKSSERVSIRTNISKLYEIPKTTIKESIFESWEDSQTIKNNHSTIKETLQNIKNIQKIKQTYYNSILKLTLKKIQNWIILNSTGSTTQNIKSIVQYTQTTLYLNKLADKLKRINQQLLLTEKNVPEISKSFFKTINIINQNSLISNKQSLQTLNNVLNSLSEISPTVELNELKKENDIQNVLTDFLQRLSLLKQERDKVLKAQFREKIKTKKTLLNSSEQLKVYQNIIDNYKTYNAEEDIGYELVDFIYPGSLTANAGETVVSVLDKIKNTLGNYEYYYDINGYFIFQEIKNYLNKSYSTYILNSDNSPSYDYNLVSGKNVYDFSSGEIIQSYQNSPQYQNIKNDFIVWGERKTTNGQKIPIRYHLAIDYQPSAETYYCFECPNGYTINNQYQQKADLPITGQRNVYYYVQNENQFYEWTTPLDKTYKDASNNQIDYNSSFAGYKKCIPPSQVIFITSYDSFVYNYKKRTFSTEEIIDGQYHSLFYDANYDRYYKIRTNPTSQENLFILQKYPSIKTCYIVTQKDLTKKIFEEGVYYYCPTTDTIYTGNNNISKKAIKTSLQPIKTKDYRMELLLQGISSKRMGLNANDYYNELEIEWPKLYGIFPKNASSKTGTYKVNSTNLSNIDYFLDLLSSTDLIAKYGIPNIGKRTQIISNNNINCVFEPVCEDLFYLDKNAPVNQNQSVLEQKKEALQLKEKRSQYRKTYKQWLQKNELFQQSSLIEVDHQIYKNFVNGGTARSAYEEIRTALYQYITYNEMVSLTALPIYYLQPNVLVTIDDENTHIKGSYMIKSLSLPLGSGGAMNLSCVKALTRI